MKNTLRKAFLLMALATIVAGGAFAQRVGDTVQFVGQNSQSYTIQRIDGNTLTLQRVLSLYGVWASSTGSVFTITGDTGVYTQMSTSVAYIQDAVRKGLIKVGDQAIRNLRKTGDLTWTGQFIQIMTSNNNTVATSISWSNFTFTLSADSQSFNAGGAIYTRR